MTMRAPPQAPRSSAAARLLCLCTLLASAGAAAGEKESAEQLLLGFIDEVRTFEADFTQSLLDRDGEAEQTWSGRFWLKRPGQFRWRYDAPYVQEIIGDGEFIYQYDEELSQLIIDFQRDLLATAPTRFLFDRQALSQFDIHDYGRLGDLKLVQLRDKRRDTAYEEFLIAFKDGLIATIEMRDSFDQVTRISYSGVRVNQRIAKQDLRLPELPAGVDVLDRSLDGKAGEDGAPGADGAASGGGE